MTNSESTGAIDEVKDLQVRKKGASAKHMKVRTLTRLRTKTARKRFHVTRLPVNA